MVLLVVTVGIVVKTTLLISIIILAIPTIGSRVLSVFQVIFPLFRVPIPFSLRVVGFTIGTPLRLFAVVLVDGIIGDDVSCYRCQIVYKTE